MVTASNEINLNNEDEVTGSLNAEPIECRVCFAAETHADEADPENLKSERLRRLLFHPCKCKGSMSYIHELCLVKWLLARNIRHCELCKSTFTIKEEVGSVWEITKTLIKLSM